MQTSTKGHFIKVLLGESKKSKNLRVSALIFPCEMVFIISVVKCIFGYNLLNNWKSVTSCNFLHCACPAQSFALLPEDWPQSFKQYTQNGHFFIIFYTKRYDMAFFKKYFGYFDNLITWVLLPVSSKAMFSLFIQDHIFG